MSSKNVHILLTSVGRRVELVQAFRDAAIRLGIRLTITGADLSASAPALAYCDRTALVPRISDPAYIPALLQLCSENHIDGLIPTIDTDLLLLSQQKQKFEQIGTQVFISATDKIKICRDKRATADYFNSLGLYAPVAVADVQQYCGQFPAFIKPKDGSSSIGANRADSLQELQMYAAQLDEYVVQPFATGTEYTVDIFCDLQGNPVYITPRIRSAVRSGEVLKTQICYRDQIVSEMLTLLQDFKPCGPITVQLIRNEEKNLNQYIEINPRFGGGAPLSMKAGADAAQALLRLLMGQKLSYEPHAAADGAIYSRFDQCVCVDQGQNRPLKAVIFDLDDTLYSEKEYVRSGYRAVAKLLPQIDGCEQKLWAAFQAGKPAIDAVLGEAGIVDPAIKEKCLEAYRLQVPQISLYDGVEELMTWLREHGIQIGIITDGRPEGQRRKLEALGLYPMVDSVLITDELGSVRCRKPNDIAYRIMQARFNIPYGQMLYVGDNPAKDFQAPRQLGMRWIYFQNPDGLYSEKTDDLQKVNSVWEMAEMIKRVSE